MLVSVHFFVLLLHKVFISAADDLCFYFKILIDKVSSLYICTWTKSFFPSGSQFMVCTHALRLFLAPTHTSTHPLLTAFPIPLLASPCFLSSHPVSPQATPLVLT